MTLSYTMVHGDGNLSLNISKTEADILMDAWLRRILLGPPGYIVVLVADSGFR